MDIDRNRNIRIFVSSTFRDMNDERNYLMEVIFPELIRIARQRNINVSIIDLRWGITDEDALKKLIDMCLSQIDSSRPHFIGIIGERYGYIPDSEIIKKATVPPLGEREKWTEKEYSITHIEMDYGVLSRPGMARFAYFYFKDLNNKSTNLKDAQKLQDLLKTIKVKNAPWHWNKVPFGSTKELGEQVKKDFIQMLDANYPVKPLTALELERSYYKQYSTFLLRNYVEDIGIINAIIKNIDENANTIVTGKVGAGKSSVLAFTKIEYQKKHPGAFIIEHYIGVAGSNTSRGIAIHILRELIEWIRKFDSSFTGEIPSDEDEIYHKLLDWQSFIRDSDRLLLIIDGLDQLYTTSESKFLGYLKKIKVLASCRDATQMFEHLKIFNYREVKLGALNHTRKIQVIENVLYSIGKKMEPYQIEKIASYNASGNPLYLRTLLDEIIRIGVLKKPDETQAQFMDRQIDSYLSASTLPKLYNRILSNLDHIMDKYFDSPDVTGNILKLIALSRNGLSENEIALILGIGMFKIEAVKNYLDYHLAVKNNNIDFLHLSLKEAIYKKYLRGVEVKRKTREIIVNWFLTQEPDARQLDEVPYQLYMLNSKNKLKEYLSEVKIFSLFMEKYPGTKYFELIGYLRFTLGKGYICGRIIEMYNHIKISDDPLLLRDLGMILKNYYCLKQSALIFSLAIEADKKLHGGAIYSGIADDYSNMGKVYSFLKEYKTAESLFEKAIEINRKLHNNTHPDIARDISNLGAVYRCQGINGKAEKLFKEAIEINKKFYGNEHPDIARDLLQLGECYYGMKNYVKSLSMFKRAYKIHKKYYPSGGPDVARELKGFGLIDIKLKKYRMAMINFQSSMDIYIRLFGFKHPEIAANLTGIARVNVLQGNCDEGLKNLRKARDILIKLSVDNHVYSENIRDLDAKIQAVREICEN